jgi:hypothetical protein
MNDDTHDLTITTPSLEQVRQRFESWRQRRKKRTRIPPNLWQAAIALSEEYSICHLSKVLRVNYTTLKEKVVDANTPDKHTRDVLSSAFIELPHPAPPLPESTSSTNGYGQALHALQATRSLFDDTDPG